MKKKSNVVNVIFFLIIGLLACYLVYLEIDYQLGNKKVMEQKELRQLFCVEQGGDYIEFNETDYCYGVIPSGLLLIEMEDVCYEEGLCTFRLKE